MKKQLTLKTIVVCELNNRLNELRTVVEKLAEKSDNLDIELVRKIYWASEKTRFEIQWFLTKKLN